MLNISFCLYMDVALGLPGELCLASGLVMAPDASIFSAFPQGQRGV